MDTESMATERARRAWEAEQEATHAAEIHAEQQRAQRTEVGCVCVGLCVCWAVCVCVGPVRDVGGRCMGGGMIIL